MNVRPGICANEIGDQAQTAVAAVTNTGADHDGVSNSAEVEQETEQENECTVRYLRQHYWSSNPDRLLLLLLTQEIIKMK